MLELKAEIAVLGAGLAGSLLIQALLEQGCEPRQLVLLDQRLSASGASGVPWALMHPFPGRSLYPREGYLEAWRLSLNWLDKLAADCPGRWLSQLPLWRLAYEPEGARRFERSFVRGLASQADYPLSRLAAAERALLAEPLAAYQLQEARLIKVPLLLAELQRRQAEAGVRSLNYLENLALQAAGSDWLLENSELRLRVRQLVLSPGSALSQLLPDLPLLQSRGELALFELPADPQLKAAISITGKFVAPLAELERPGLYYTGATHTAFDRPQQPELVWQTLKADLNWLPGIEQARLLRTWSGVRSHLQDREPLVGGLRENLSVLAGFSTRGLLLIPAAAQALARELLGQKEQIPRWMHVQRLRSA